MSKRSFVLTYTQSTHSVFAGFVCGVDYFLGMDGARRLRCTAMNLNGVFRIPFTLCN
jgi:hypothetical protein